MPLCLVALDNDCWNILENGANDGDSGFHFLTLASVDQQGQPQARTLVLRRVDRLTRVLEFHTDMRSAKWQALKINPAVAVLGYSNKIQLRLQGTAELHVAHSPVAAAAWQRLPNRTQKTYAEAAPGSDIDITSANEARAEDNFGVLLITISLLDYCKLARENNQRALLNYCAAGALTSSKWVNP